MFFYFSPFIADLFPSLLDDFVIELDAREGSGALTVHNGDEQIFCSPLPSANQLGFDDQLHDTLPADNSAENNHQQLSINTECEEKEAFTAAQNSALGSTKFVSLSSHSRRFTEPLCGFNETNGQLAGISYAFDGTSSNSRAIKQNANISVEPCDNSSNDSSLIDVVGVEDAEPSLPTATDVENKCEELSLLALDTLLSASGASTVPEIDCKRFQSVRHNIRGQQQSNYRTLYLQPQFSCGYITTVAPSRKPKLPNVVDFSSLFKVPSAYEVANTSDSLCSVMPPSCHLELGMMKSTQSCRPKTLCVPLQIETSSNKVSAPSLNRRKREQSKHNTKLLLSEGSEKDKSVLFKTRSGRIVNRKKNSDFVYSRLMDCTIEHNSNSLPLSDKQDAPVVKQSDGNIAHVEPRRKSCIFPTVPLAAVSYSPHKSSSSCSGNLQVIEIPSSQKDLRITKQHTALRLLICHLCLQTIPSQAALDDHMSVHHSRCDQLFPCRCGITFSSETQLKAHYNKNLCTQLKDLFQCRVCNIQFEYEIQYNKHLKILHPDHKFLCYVCDERFDCLKNLKTHMKLHCKKQLFVCPYCSKYFWIRGCFNRHFRNHFRKYECRICAKHYNSKANYDKHVAGHAVGRNLGYGTHLQCTNCGDLVDNSTVLALRSQDNSHHKVCLRCNKGLYKRYTINEIPKDPSVKYNDVSDTPCVELSSRYECPHCDAVVSDVCKHIKRVHQQPLVACHVCNAKVKRDCLQSHLNRLHSRVTNVICDHCNKTFKSVMSFREHLTRVKKKGRKYNNNLVTSKITISKPFT